jgi:S1-C subfamily serine protease
MGMNTAGLIRGGTSLPPETLSRIIQRLLQGTGARRAYLGASFIPVKLPPGHVEGRSRALLTVGIEPGGPAELAGLSLGDVLLGLGSSTFDGLPALLAWLADHSPGDAVDAHLLRAGVPAGLSVTPTARED